MKIFINLFFITTFLFSQPQVTQKGVDLVKYYEGFRGKAYLCPAGVLTIGYGHTGKDIVKGAVISKVRGEQILREDFRKFEKYTFFSVKRLLNWNEFDGLVSFTFNVGYKIKGNLKNFVERGNVKNAVIVWRQYNKAKVNNQYIVLSGLVKRRNSETVLFSTGVLKF